MLGNLKSVCHRCAIGTSVRDVEPPLVLRVSEPRPGAQRPDDVHVIYWCLWSTVIQAAGYDSKSNLCRWVLAQDSFRAGNPARAEDQERLLETMYMVDGSLWVSARAGAHYEGREFRRDPEFAQASREASRAAGRTYRGRSPSKGKGKAGNGAHARSSSKGKGKGKKRE
jgi:hypothetical protein